MKTGETIQKSSKNSIQSSNRHHLSLISSLIVMGLLAKIRQVEMRVGVDEVDLLLVLGRHLRAAVLVV